MSAILRAAWFAASAVFLSVVAHEQVHVLQVWANTGELVWPRYWPRACPGTVACVAPPPSFNATGWWAGEGPAYVVQALFSALCAVPVFIKRNP